jgi:hypothetical protein
MFATTSRLVLRRGGAITKPKAKRQKRRRPPSGLSQTEADNSDSIPTLEGLSVNEPVAHQKSEEIYVQTIFQSNSWSERNESIKNESTRNKSITRRERFLTRRRTKQSTVKRNTTVSSGYSSLRGSEASHGNEHSTGDKVGLDPSIFPVHIEDVVDRPIVRGTAGTSDDSESRKVLVIEKEDEAQMQFVRVPSTFSVVCGFG